MDEYIMYHKPNCSTSLKTLNLLKSHGIEPKLRLYLEDVPTQTELRELLKKMDGKITSILRTKEPIYKGNYANKKLTKAQWLKILTEHPILIDRPILIKGNNAVLCRPVERALELL